VQHRCHRGDGGQGRAEVSGVEASSPPGRGVRQRRGKGEHGERRGTPPCRAAMKLQEVNEALAKNPLEFFFLLQISPFLLFFYSLFKTSRF
jgi:hypothetical protein